MRCPISSHVRRANPRDARGGTREDSRDRRQPPPHPAPRPLATARRCPTTTRSPAATTASSRGLYFICLQASIARGFEFIQQTWLANPGFHGLHGEPDPIIGNSGGTLPFTIPAEPVRLRLADVSRRSSPTLGGGYFFLPSLSALARIAAGPRAQGSAGRGLAKPPAER